MIADSLKFKSDMFNVVLCGMQKYLLVGVMAGHTMVRGV